MSVLHLGTDPVDVGVLMSDAANPRIWEFGVGVEGVLRDHHRLAASIAATTDAYGRTTGVGANRDVAADDADGEHGLRLVRSHAAGGGRPLPEEVGRATMLVRAHQLCTPGSGAPPEIVDAIRRAANDRRTPVLREFGGMGTGDITGLAELALCLLGERAWSDGQRARYLDGLDGSGALALMSSSAPTIATAAFAVDELEHLLQSSLVVAAAGAAAVAANGQQWSMVAERTMPSPGVSVACASLRRLLDGGTWAPARTQDPLSWRTMPFVLGPAIDAAAELRHAVDGAISARAENPQYTTEGVFHHGAFNLTGLALRLDVARLALTQWASTSLARLVKLHDPAYSGGSRFLASGPAGSSGTMVLEYTAGSALETVRTLADPTSRHTVTISIGNEDQAPFATRGAVALCEQVVAARVVFACELLAAVRALRGAAAAAPCAAARAVLESCADLRADETDRPLTDDVDRACEILGQLGSDASV